MCDHQQGGGEWGQRGRREGREGRADSELLNTVGIAALREKLNKSNVTCMIIYCLAEGRLRYRRLQMAAPRPPPLPADRGIDHQMVGIAGLYKSVSA